jgi:hypothetical protein
VSRNIIESTFDTFGVSAGLKRQGNTWSKRDRETIVVINLQQSRFGPQYYVNFAIWLLALGDVDRPKEQHCQIRTRLDSVINPEAAARLGELLDLDQDINEFDRREQLLRLLESNLPSLIDACETVERLRTGRGAEIIANALVNGQGQELLGLR